MNREQKRAAAKAVTKAARNSNSWGLPWQWQEVTLSTGQVLRVRGMPPYLADAAVANLPLPQIPLISIPSQVPGGGTTVRENPDDPEYKQAMNDVMTKRGDRIKEFQLHWGVDLEIPESLDWKDEIARFLPEIVWSPYGDRVDYLKYVILVNVADLIKVQRIISGLDLVRQEEVDSVVESFRDQALE